MRPVDLVTLVALGALWGASFLFIRVAAPVLGPFALSEVRTLLAAVTLLLVALATGARPAFRARWRSFLALGAINSALPFALIAAATVHLPASLASILNATTPLVAALVAASWGGEPITPRKAAGLALGLAGVVGLLGWSPIAVTPAVLGAVVMAVLGAACYAVGGLYAARAFRGIPTLTLAIGQQVGAALVLLPMVAADLPVGRPSARVVLATLGLALPSTALAYLLYFRLIARVGGTRTVSVTYLVPGFGVLWGALFLDESVGPSTLLALATILVGIGLVTGVHLPARGVRATARGA